jgi:ankyrin repeat protein
VHAVRLLLDHAADVNAYFTHREGSETWIQTSLYGAAGIANNPELTRMLLEAGADVNERQRDPGEDTQAVSYGLEALYHASEFADVTCLRLLLEARPALHSRDDLSLTPFRSAVRHGRDDVARLLREAGADETALVADDRTPSRPDPDLLCYAAGGNDVEATRRLLDADADPNALGGLDETPPLHWACWRGAAEAAQLLTGRGAKIHTLNRYGGDALGTTIHGSLNCHDVFGGISMKLPEEIAHGDYPAIVRMLVAAGARLPQRVGGSEAVQEVLRAAGVPNAE